MNFWQFKKEYLQALITRKVTNLLVALQILLQEPFFELCWSDLKKYNDHAISLFEHYCYQKKLNQLDLFYKTHNPFLTNNYGKSEIDEKTKLLHKMYQFKPVDVTQIASVLYAWYPKKNTLVLEGIPNSGKSLLAKALCYEKIVGHIDRLDKTSAHVLENTIAKEIVLWEEAFLLPEFYEIFKLVLGGEPFPVNAKFKPIMLNNQRTPVIITCNKKFDLYCPNDGAMEKRTVLLTLNTEVKIPSGIYITENDVLHYLHCVMIGCKFN